MRKETDLAGIKALGHAMLNTDIRLTAHAPMIVSHPFTSSGITGLRDSDGGFIIGNLLDNPDDLSKWRNQVGALIDDAESAYDVFNLINKPYMLAFIKYGKPYLSEQDLGQILSCAWILNETPSKTFTFTPNQGYNQLMGNREQAIQACEVMRLIASDCSKLDAEIEALNEEIQVIAGLVNQCIKENATTQQSQDEYTQKYNRLVKRYEKAVARLNKVSAEKERRMQRDRELRIFIEAIEKQPLVLECWDERLWISLLETATVRAEGKITFRFKDGTEIEVGAE